MFNSIDLTNFKSWLSGKIELSSGITAILGDPQSGKSNILKAMGFLVKHNPTRFDKVSSNINPDGDVNVTINVDHNLTDIPISLNKTENKTEYKIADEDPYSSVGVSVPEKVSNILNLSDLYMQGQIDEPFLITSSAGEVSRTINKIIHLDEINKWITNITSKFNSLNGELKIVEKDQINLEKKITSYDFVDDVSSRLSEAENFQIMRSDAIIRYERLYEAYNEYQKIDELITTESIRIGAIKDGIKGLKKLQYDFLKDKESYDLLDKYLLNKKQLGEEENTNKNLKNKLINIKIKLDGINNIKNKISNVEDKKTVVSIYIKNKKLLDRKLNIIKLARDEYKNLLKEMKICPTCKTNITDRKINIIMESL